jgi:tetratricopeptide (TPR) repeat protein
MLMRGEESLNRVVFRVSLGFLVGALALLAVSLSVSSYYLEERQPQLAASGDMEGALQLAQTAERLDPFSADPLQSQSYFLQQQGRNEEAAERLRAAIERNPNDYVLYQLLGNMQLAQLDDIDAAIQSYRRAQELNPKEASTGTLLAQALIRKGDLKGAREEFEKLESSGEITFGGLYDLGRIYARTGEPAKGVDAIRRAKGKAAAELDELEGAAKAEREELIRSMDLALADALVVQGKYTAARRVLEESPSGQAPALLELLNADPEGYRQSVVDSEIY